jgi:hypothetical protein
MQKIVRYFVSYRAYRSEIALFRKEGAPLIVAWRQRRVLTRISSSFLRGARSGVTVWSDGLKVLNAMKKHNAFRLFSLAVL